MPNRIFLDDFICVRVYMCIYNALINNLIDNIKLIIYIKND